jgi:hypothetical protein
VEKAITRQRARVIGPCSAGGFVQQENRNAPTPSSAALAWPRALSMFLSLFYREAAVVRVVDEAEAHELASQRKGEDPAAGGPHARQQPKAPRQPLPLRPRVGHLLTVVTTREKKMRHGEACKHYAERACSTGGGWSEMAMRGLINRTATLEGVHT